MDWLKMAAQFTWDGSLRDVYVVDAAVADWQAAWSFLIGHSGNFAFSIDGRSNEPPVNVGDVFAVARDHSVLASCKVGGQRLNCHFFDPSQIEFDIDPRDIDGIEALNALERFMTALGCLTSKTVVLTHENDIAAVIGRFDPKVGEVKWAEDGDTGRPLA